MISVRTLLASIGLAGAVAGSYWSIQAQQSADLPAGAPTEAPTPPTVTYTSTTAPEDRRVFYGDLHLHTTYSNDAWSWGTKVTPAIAYAFAKGETVKLPAIQVLYEQGVKTGDVAVRRAWALDFLAVTDHAESLGGSAQLDHADSPRGQTDEGKQYRANPTHGRGAGGARGAAGGGRGTPQEAAAAGRAGAAAAGQGGAAAPGAAGAGRAGRGAAAGAGRGANPLASDPGWMSRVWQETKRAANDAYQPGKFTTLIAYEWTATRSGWIHRNVIFNGDDAPLPFTASQSTRPEDLWTFLEGVRAGGRDAIAIPHNSNYNNAGFVFDWNTSDDKPIDQAYALRRALNEPLAEITQNKGTSETTPGLSPNDEFSNFELVDTIQNSTIGGKYIRQAYGRGLVIQSKVGANPYKFGLVGASDIHNGLSVSDESGFAGGHFGIDPQSILPSGNYARNILRLPPVGANGASEAISDGGTLTWSPGALTGVWAEENTRNSIFAALKRKETFATSGTRLRLRMFGGWSFPVDLLRNRDWVRECYTQGVPMGADLPARPANAAAPALVVQATKDPDGANLDRLQIVKVWLENGVSMEKVFDIALSGTRTTNPATGRSAEAVGNTVDLQTGRYTNTIGAAMLSVVWQDPEFNPEQPAVYYARVLEIPTPRWSTLLAIRNRLPLSTQVPPTLQERGWSSPIWYTPSGR